MFLRSSRLKTLPASACAYEVANTAIDIVVMTSAASTDAALRGERPIKVPNRIRVAKTVAAAAGQIGKVWYGATLPYIHTSSSGTSPACGTGNPSANGPTSIHLTLETQDGLFTSVSSYWGITNRNGPLPSGSGCSTSLLSSYASMVYNPPGFCLRNSPSSRVVPTAGQK